MEKIALSIEQMKHLESLGLDTSDASMERSTECSTLSLVQKWLREEKDILLIVNPIYNPLDEFVGYECEIRHHYTQYDKSGIFRTSPFSHTYEQCLSAGIDKCIEILKK